MGVELAILLGKGWILLGIQPFVMGVGSLKWVEYGLLGEMLAGFSKLGETGKIALLQDGMRGCALLPAFVSLFSGCLKSLPSGFVDGCLLCVKTIWQRWVSGCLVV